LGSNSKLSQEEESEILDFLNMEDTDTDYKEDDIAESFLSGPSVPNKEEDTGNKVCYLEIEDTDITYRDQDLPESLLKHKHFKRNRSRVFSFFKRRSSLGSNSKLSQEEESEILDFLNMEDTDTGYKEDGIAESFLSGSSDQRKEEDAGNKICYLDMEDTDITYRDGDLPESTLEDINFERKLSLLDPPVKRRSSFGSNSKLNQVEKTQVLDFLDIEDNNTDFNEYYPGYN